MSAQNSRKRPAPGSAPLLPVVNSPPGQQDQMMRWSNALPEAASINEASRNSNGFIVGPVGNQYLQQPLQPGLSQAASKMHSQSMPPSSQPQAAPMSTAIARRPPNRALVPSVPRSNFDVSADPWATFPDDGAGSGLANGGHPGENVSIEILEERAQRIIKEAQAKRKQIPPFVQKLSSFLEEEKNTDLIRWSANGDSFIVLDEDEFAKTLIPELFKHNNYASFVRQLNMYGFHKRVGLSDNSMKASERKNKSPSEYYNPYFRRGHPNLLWLINKPKSGSKSKKGKKDDGDGDSDEEAGMDEPMSLNFPALGSQASRPYGPSGGGGGNGGFVGGGSGGGGGSSGGSGGGGSGGEVGPLQRKDLQLIKEELSTLQSRQAQISKVMQRLQYDNGKLQQQARMFQNMHDRHENSINAILNFLANVFRKSLEEQGSVQGVTELLASILPNGQIPQGSVVDLGDEFERRSSMASSISTPPPKRPQRLLPPIPANGLTALQNATSTSRSGGASGLRSVASPTSVHSVMGGTKMAPGGSSSGHNGNSGSLASYFPGLQIGQAGSITELADSPNDMAATAPNSSLLQQELQANPQEGMMRIINDTNASISSPNSALDLSEMVASTPVTLSNDQRSRVLSLMSAQHGGGGGGLPATSGTILPSTTGGTVGDLPMPTADMGGIAPESTTSMPAPAPAATARRDGRGGYAIPPSPASLAGAHMGGAASHLGLLGNRASFGGGLGGAASTGAGADPSGMMTASGLTLSPILSSVPAIQPPSLQDISNTQAEIEALQRLQDEQNAKISDLSQLLGPLSPSGRIPGIDDDAGVVLPGSGISPGSVGGGGGVGMGGISGSGNPEYFDLSQYLDSNAFGDDFNFATGDMGMDGDGVTADHIQQQQQQQQQQQHQQQLGDPTDTGEGVDDYNFGIDSIKTGVSTENIPSPATTEEILRTDFKSDSPDSTAKRRRVV